VIFIAIHISKRIEFRENSLFETILVEKMSGALTLLEVEGGAASSKDIRVPNVAVEITGGSRLCLKWDDMYARYVIS
jgi:hypothetical protein